MTERETVKVVTMIVMSYPAAEKFKDENTIKATVNIWKAMFKDDNARLVELAVQKHIATNKWPPSIAEIREQMVTLEHPEIIPPDIAWTAVSDALATFSSAHTPELPPLIQSCVETIGWSRLQETRRGQYAGAKPGMDRMIFMQQYIPTYEREREKAMLPKTLADAVRKSEKALGGEAYKLIDAARQTRVDKENMWNQAGRKNYERTLERYKRKLGGNDNV